MRKNETSHSHGMIEGHKALFMYFWSGDRRDKLKILGLSIFYILTICILVMGGVYGLYRYLGGL